MNFNHFVDLIVNIAIKKGFDVKIDIDVDKYCYSCGDDNITTDFQYENISPCDYCQIEEFIREIGDRV